MPTCRECQTEISPFKTSGVCRKCYERLRKRDKYQRLKDAGLKTTDKLPTTKSPVKPKFKPLSEEEKKARREAFFGGKQTEKHEKDQPIKMVFTKGEGSFARDFEKYKEMKKKVISQLRYGN